MLIAVDIDEVLADFSRGLVEYYNKKHGLYLPGFHETMTEWWQAWGETRAEAVERVYEFVRSREIIELEPIPGSVAGIKELKALGHELIVVTGRPIESMDETWAWLEVYYPGAFRRAYSTDFHIISQDKDRENKGDICARRGVKLLIDDFYDYCREASERGVPSLLFTTPWNRHLQLPADISRVNSWPEIVERLNNF